jgi:hypothetical protein
MLRVQNTFDVRATRESKSSGLRRAEHDSGKEGKV